MMTIFCILVAGHRNFRSKLPSQASGWEWRVTCDSGYKILEQGVEKSHPLIATAYRLLNIITGPRSHVHQPVGKRLCPGTH